MKVKALATFDYFPAEGAAMVTVHEGQRPDVADELGRLWIEKGLAVADGAPTPAPAPPEAPTA